LIDAVQFGVAAGAAAVMNLGTELCRREDAERLFDAMPMSELGAYEAVPIELRSLPMIRDLLKKA
jgi:hypothetical protein